MATPLLFCGSLRNQRPSRARRRCRDGASLLELIIVLFIIGIMASLLFPALQAARRKVKGTECQNNVRQLGVALAQCIQSWKRFPAQGRWTVDILKWIEEEPLARQMANGIPPGAVFPRPGLYRCEDQPEVGSTVPDVFVCHYVLAVDRSSWAMKPERTPWMISDRPGLDPEVKYPPWYLGSEMTLDEQRVMFEMMQGPHPGGLFNLSNGQTRGGK